MDINAQLIAAMKDIFGSKPDGYYIVSLVFSLIGIIISLYALSRKRDKDSKNTPYKFSWTFSIWDNFKRLLVTMLFMFVLFRVMDITSIPAMIGVGIGVTISFDQLLNLAMEKWNWLGNVMSKDRSDFPKMPDENKTPEI